MVTCNIRHRNYGEGNVITKLNFSIPVTVLLPFFQFVTNKGKKKKAIIEIILPDRTLLASFDIADPDIKALWQLQLRKSEEEEDVSTKPKQNFHGLKSGEKFSSFLQNFKQSKL
jgi:hypothetical protein